MKEVLFSLESSGNGLIYRVMLRLLLGIFFFLGTSVHCFSQNNVHGQVQDAETLQEIPYVTVRLLKPDSTFVKGTTTDSLGIYRFEDIYAGKYILAFSYIGYQPLLQPTEILNKDNRIQTINLRVDNQVLDEVVVKASSYIRKDDHVLIVPDKQQVKHGSTGYDLLYNLMIPNVEVNRRTGNVSTLGGSVTLYINGEEASFRDVQALRPRDIENVEYYDVPVGKYAKDVAAINYITKKYKSGGYVALDGQQTIGYLKGDYNVASKINVKNNTFSVFGGYGMQDYDGMASYKYETILLSDHITNRERNTENSGLRNNQQYVQFKWNNANKKRDLSAQFSFVRSDSPEEWSMDNLIYSGSYSETTQSETSKSSESLKPSVKLYGNFKLSSRQTLDFTLNGSYTRNKYSRIYTEGDNRSFTDVGEDAYNLRFVGNYNLRLKHQNALGVNLYHTHKVASSTYGGDYSSWQHLWSGETVLFMSYTQKLKNVRFIIRPGFSQLNYKLHGDDLQKHTTLRFNTMLIHSLSKARQMRYYINIGNVTPDISFINDVDQKVDFLQIVRGNPYLDNTKMYNVGVNYAHQWKRLNLQLGVDYMGFKDNTSYTYYEENGMLINSFTSNGDAQTAAFNAGLTYRFSDNFRAKLSLKYAFQEATGNYDFTDNSLFAALDLNYFVGNFSFNVYGTAQTGKNNVWTYITEKKPITYGMTLGWSNKGWHIEAGAENPFSTENRYREYANYGIYRFEDVRTSPTYQQTGYVKLSYTFDFGKKTSRDKKDVDTKIDSSILKAK